MIRALFWTGWGIFFLPRMLWRRHGWRLQIISRAVGKLGTLGFAPLPHVPVGALLGDYRTRKPGYERPQHALYCGVWHNGDGRCTCDPMRSDYAPPMGLARSFVAEDETTIAVARMMAEQQRCLALLRTVKLREYPR